MRAVVDGRVRWALPHTLVELTDERVAWLIRPGTRGIAPVAYAEGRRHYLHDLARGDWQTEPFEWHTNRVLRLTTFGRAHSLDLYWDDATDEFRGWYVNLQQPLRPSRLRRPPGQSPDGLVTASQTTPWGFDMRDHALDVWIEPDGAWRWKDEDELALGVELGVWSAEEAATFRAEGERVIAERPWPTGWEDWRPDAAWPIPELPPDWHVV